MLDSNNQPLPVGSSGELHIKGVGLARGYINHVKLTANSFIPCNLLNEKGLRIYKSGDLVHYLKDGNIEFLDRLDNQVKIRGHRIELGEIESVILGYAGVSDGVVLAREDQPGDKRLVAYLVPSEGKDPDIVDIREYLKKKLPCRLPER